jgi:hypothetical protein
LADALDSIWILQGGKGAFVQSQFTSLLQVDGIKWINVSSLFFSEAAEFFVVQVSIRVCVQVIEDLVDIGLGQFNSHGFDTLVEFLSVNGVVTV